MMVIASILQLVSFVYIGTKPFHDNNNRIYLYSYIVVDLIPDPHNIAYICVTVTILVFIIVLVTRDK